MATLVVYSDAADGRLRSYSETYSTARSGGGMDVSNTYVTAGQWPWGIGFYLFEGFVSFDTSAVSGTSAVLTLTTWEPEVNNLTPFTCNARSRDWGTTLEVGDWVAGADLSALTLLASRSTSGMENYTAYDFASEPAMVTALGGWVRMVLSSSRMEAATVPSGDEYVAFRASEAEGTTSDPKLTITFTGHFIAPTDDVTTTGWTSTPLWSKIDDAPASPDGTVVTATAA